MCRVRTDVQELGITDRSIEDVGDEVVELIRIVLRSAVPVFRDTFG